MNRNEIITKLVKEGFSEKTLIRFNDNQLKKFSDKILGEGLKVKADDLKADPALADKLKDKDVTVVPEEETMEPNVKKMTKKDVKEIASKSKIKRLDLKKLNEFVESVVDKKYHSLTTKGEISELVKEKIGASQISEFEMAEPAVKPDVKPAPTKPDTDTPKRERPRHPGQRPQDPNKKPLPDPVPKAGAKEISGDEAKSKIIGMIDKIFREN